MTDPHIHNKGTDHGGGRPPESESGSTFYKRFLFFFFSLSAARTGQLEQRGSSREAQPIATATNDLFPACCSVGFHGRRLRAFEARSTEWPCALLSGEGPSCEFIDGKSIFACLPPSLSLLRPPFSAL